MEEKDKNINIPSDTLKESIKSVNISLQSLNKIMIEQIKATGKYKDIITDTIDLESELQEIISSATGELDKWGDDLSIALKGVSDFSDTTKITAKLTAYANKNLLKAGIDIAKTAEILAKKQEELETYRSGAREIGAKIFGPIKNMLSKLEKIPGGGLISGLLNLPGILDKVEKKLVKNVYEALKTNNSMAGAIITTLKDGMKDVGNVISSNPSLVFFSLLAGFIIGAFLVWRKFYATTKAIRDETGLLADNSERLSKEVRNVVEQNKSLGVSYEIAGKAAAGLFNEFKNVNMITPDLIEGASVLGGAYGVSAEDAAKLLRTLKVTGGLTDKQAKNLSFAVGALANLKGVSPQKVLSDMAKSAKEINLYFRGNVKEAAKASVELNRMGLSLQKAAGISQNLLSFDTSIESELEASVLLNRQIDLSMARQKAFMGDIEGATTEVLKQVGDIDAFNSMNVLQKEAIAKASGMEVDELANALQQQKQLSKLSFSQREELKKINDELNGMKDSSKGLVEDANRQLQTEKLINTVTEAFYNLISGLQPIFDVLLDSLNTISWIIKGITTPLRFLSSEFGMIGKILGTLITLTLLWVGMKGLGKAKEIVSRIGHSKYFGDVLGNFGMGKKTMKVPTTVAETVATKSTDVLETQATKGVSILKRINTIIKDFSSVIQSSIKMIFNSIATAINGLSKIITSIVKLVTSAFTNLMSGLAKGIKVFIDTLGKIKPQTAAQAAFALITLAGALYLFSLAVKPFADINWETLGKAGASLLGLALIAWGISKISSDVLVASVAIAILGASLIPLSYAMTLMEKVSWETLGKAAVALVGFTLAVFGLGALLVSGLGTALFAAGIVGMIALAGAITSLGIAFTIFNQGVGGMDSMIDGFSRLGSVAPNLLLAAAGIAAIGYALAAFGAGQVAGGLGSFIGGLLGGDPIAKLERLALAAPGLSLAAVAISNLNTSLSNFKVPDIDNLDAVSEIGEMALKQTVNQNPTVNVAPPVNDELIKKMSEMVDAIEGMKVVMDAKEVGKVISENSDRPGRG